MPTPRKCWPDVALTQMRETEELAGQGVEWAKRLDEAIDRGDRTLAFMYSARLKAMAARIHGLMLEADRTVRQNAKNGGND